MLKPDLAKHPGRWSLALGALHALLFWLSFPPVFAWPLAFVSLWPLLYIAWKTPRPARSGLMVGIAALPMWLAHHWWMIDVTAAGFPVLGVYLSLYAFLFVWVAARWRRRVGDGRAFWLALPVLWIGLEVLRGAVVWHGYPWYLLGHPTIDFTHPVAPLLGAYGASLLVAIFGVRAFEVLATREHRTRRTVLSAVGGALIIGLLLMAQSLRNTISADMFATIAVVQTNVPQSNRSAWEIDQKIEDFRNFAELTRGAAVQSPDLIVWPETMFPGLALNAQAVQAERDAGIVFPGGLETTAFHDELLRLQSEIGIPMLVGAIARDGLSIDIDDQGRVNLEADATFNSAFLIENGAVADARYDKMHLTPFGEYMPYISWSDWLEGKFLALGAAGMSFDLDAGRSPQPLMVHLGGADYAWSLRIATPICFEATMPGVCRRLVFRDGVRTAHVMINLTNDGWFGSSVAGRRNHELAARWRSAELQTPMVRAANTGISSVISPDGRVESRLSANTAGALTHVVHFFRYQPLYADIGDLVGWLCLAATGLICFAAVLKPRNPRTPGRSERTVGQDDAGSSILVPGASHSGKPGKGASDDGHDSGGTDGGGGDGGGDGGG
ncbi:MAG: apolipoprotein N-acyltransferase [Phycisphaerales bacterium]|nr:apolipoprotein N-acyltransferase [Phycisphaerales bacterium]